MSRCCLKTKCIRCCIHTNMLLTYRDIKKIQKIGYDRQFFVSEYNGWLQLKNDKGRCVFHTGIHCSIYFKKPEGCTLYPIVYDKNNKKAVLDGECPQQDYFPLSKAKSQQLHKLISILETERTERRQTKNSKKYKQINITF